jgi:hypothetical protein
MTVAEIMIVISIISVMVGILMTLYSKGNSASAKAVWRTSTAGKLRLALRQLKTSIEASSYPVWIDNTMVREASPANNVNDYLLTLLNPGTATVAGTLRTHTFKTAQNILQYYACTPAEDANLGMARSAAAAQSGIATLFTVALVNVGGNQYAPLGVALAQTPGTVTGGSVTSDPVFTAAGAVSTRNICMDTAQFDIVLPNITSPIANPPNANAPRTGVLFSITITARDPVDGRMALAETIQVKSNVGVAYP